MDADRPRHGLFVALALSLGLTGMAAGCLATVPMHTAEPIPRGETELGVSGGVGLLGESERESSPSSRPGFGFSRFIGHGSIQIRHGISEQVGVGARLSGYAHGAIDVNWMVLDEPNLAFSVNPTFAINAEWPELLGTLNLLFDIVRADNWTLTLGAKPGYFHRPQAGRGYGPAMGATVLAKIMLGEGVGLLPYLDAAGWHLGGKAGEMQLSSGVGFTF